MSLSARLGASLVEQSVDGAPDGGSFVGVAGVEESCPLRHESRVDAREGRRGRRGHHATPPASARVVRHG